MRNGKKPTISLYSVSPFLYIVLVHLENFYGRTEEEQLVKIYIYKMSQKKRRKRQRRAGL